MYDFCVRRSYTSMLVLPQGAGLFEDLLPSPAVRYNIFPCRMQNLSPKSPLFIDLSVSVM